MPLFLDVYTYIYVIFNLLPPPGVKNKYVCQSTYVHWLLA